MKSIALVTGVSRLKGIGRAICLELASRGIDIFFTYWRPYDRSMPWSVSDDEPETIQQEIRSRGVACEKMELDLSKVENVQILLETATGKLGIPSILVNNATFSTSADVQSLTAKDMDRHYEINVRATALLSVEFARKLQGIKGGRIINLTSGQFQRPMLGEIAYATTKGAVDALTVTLAAELAAQHITVNAVNPGPNDTGWMDEALTAALLPRFPMGRVGQPMDVAKLVGFLASEDAAWITGQIIHAEGGFS